MGGRCIRRWLEEPLTDINSIKNKQENNWITSQISEPRKISEKSLRAMGDLERLSGRAGAQQAGARDLVAIAEGINRLPILKKYLSEKIFEEVKYFDSIINLDKDLIEIASKNKQRNNRKSSS